MSFFSRLFGGDSNKNNNGNPPPSSGGGGSKSAPPPPPAPPAARPNGGGGGGGAGSSSTVNSVQAMERAMLQLDKKRDLLEEKVKEQEDKAKQYMAGGKKTYALNCMKLKKQYEDQIEKLQAQRLNLQTTQFALETAEMNRVVMTEQQRAGNELARVNATMNPDAVQDTMDKVQEQIQDVKAANDALAQPMDLEMADDDDAEDALNALMKQDAAEKRQAAGGVAAAPATAATNVTSTKAAPQKSEADKKAEADLNKLMGGVNVPSNKPEEKVDASKSAEDEEAERLLAQLQLS